MRKKTATLKIQRWGNSLAVRIPANIARNAHFEAGTSVEVSLQELGVSVKPIGKKILTLDQRLEMFDPEKHGGEHMAGGLIGLEKFE